jgi:hypothetical protein
MEDKEAFVFVRDYFFELFEKRNISALDQYLDKEYWDDDIGEEGVDHIENSKTFLKDLFNKNPNITVIVKKAICQDNVITAYLEWGNKSEAKVDVLRKGIAVFVLKGNRIIKRHTYIYYQNDQLAMGIF